jgi:hypothetical protein
MELINDAIGSEIILDSEQIFKVSVLDILNKNDELKNFLMVKSTNPYCSVDFTVINTYNLLTCYVEHKQKKINSQTVDTFYIGYTKLVMIDTYYGQNTLFLIFQCDDELYFCEYDEKFLKRPTKIICGGKVVEINKNECGVGMDNFTKKLIQTLMM